MACLIILHNWFPPYIRGFIVSIWYSSYLTIPLLKAIFYEDDTDYSVNN